MIFLIRPNKRRSHFYPLLCLFVVISLISCKSPSKIEVAKDDIQLTEQPKEEPVDHDPYFTESTAITSPYGPRSIVRNILPDSKGNIWFASWEGIIKYDGKVFTNYTNKEGLRRYRVFTLLEDKKGNIWFGTIGAGVYLYDGKSFTNITTKDGIADDKVKTIYEDSEGNIWLGTSGGISIYDGKSFENYTEVLGLPNSDINSIDQDSNGKFWISSRGSAFVYEPTIALTSIIKPFEIIKRGEDLTFSNARSIIPDKRGNIWLGGSDGLWLYDGQSFNNHSKNFVGYIFEDSKGNIWTSSAEAKNGNSQNWVFSRYDHKSLLAGTLSPTPIKSESNMFFGINEDAQGAIWLGTLRGVYKYDDKGFTYFKDPALEE